MEDPSSNMLGPRLNFEFALNDIDFSDRVLHIEIMAETLESKSDSEGCDFVHKGEILDKENECSIVAGVKTLHISSPILAANSPFFYKLFKNGMKESQQRDVTLRINESEDAALKELLNFMYSNTLSATTIPDLLGVLIIADKFEVTSCIRYCSALLQKMPMSLESALSYLKLPPSVLVAEFVQPLTDAAKKWLVAHFKDFNKSQEEAMSLPLVAVEVVLGSDSLQVDSDSRDDVFEFILKWAREQYPKLEVRREILTNRLTKLIPFPDMTCSKLREVLICPDFDHEEVSKLVLEALFFKVELPFGQRIRASNKCELSKMERFELPQPRCVVYFDLKKEECENLFSSSILRSPSFSLGGRSFCLEAHCSTKELLTTTFGLFLTMTKGSDSFSLEFEFAAIQKSSKVFQNKLKQKVNYSNSSLGWGCPNLFGIPWTDLMSKDSEYFIEGILHLRSDLTINDSQA